MKKILYFAALVLPLALLYTNADAAKLKRVTAPDSEGEIKMEYKQFGSTYVIRLNKDAEIVSTLKEFCAARKIQLGTISGLGSLKSATLAFYNPETKEYQEKTFNEPLEMASLVGNIAVKDGQPLLHLHTTIAGDNYKAFAGHMVKATISLTGEIYIEAIKGKIEKTFDKETGLNLLDFKK